MKRANIRKFKPSGSKAGKTGGENDGAVYLNVGGDRSIPGRGILGIFDMDTATVSSVTREFLRRSERQGQTVTVKASLPKSFILYEDGVRETVYFSPFSVKSLAGRDGE